MSGIYTIFPAGFNDGLQVYCDSDTDGGGWIVIQRRQDGSVDFDRSWNDYRVGFGNLSGEFWLGNDILRTLTASTETWQLQIDIMDWQNKTATAGYGFFWISGDNYQLHVDSYNANSTAYDSLTYHNNMQFTTNDKDNDKWSEGHCGVSPLYSSGGWWYNNCFYGNLNAKYYKGGSDAPDGMLWGHWGFSYSVQKCIMKIRQ